MADHEGLRMPNFRKKRKAMDPALMRPSSQLSQSQSSMERSRSQQQVPQILPTQHTRAPNSTQRPRPQQAARHDSSLPLRVLSFHQIPRQQQIALARPSPQYTRGQSSNQRPGQQQIALARPSPQYTQGQNPSQIFGQQVPTTHPSSRASQMSSSNQRDRWQPITSMRRLFQSPPKTGSNQRPRSQQAPPAHIMNVNERSEPGSQRIAPPCPLPHHTQVSNLNVRPRPEDTSSVYFSHQRSLVPSSPGSSIPSGAISFGASEDTSQAMETVGDWGGGEVNSNATFRPLGSEWVPYVHKSNKQKTRERRTQRQREWRQISINSQHSANGMGSHNRQANRSTHNKIQGRGGQRGESLDNVREGYIPPSQRDYRKPEHAAQNLQDSGFEVSIDAEGNLSAWNPNFVPAKSYSPPKFDGTEAVEVDGDHFEEFPNNRALSSPSMMYCTDKVPFVARQHGWTRDDEADFVEAKKVRKRLRFEGAAKSVDVRTSKDSQLSHAHESAAVVASEPVQISRTQSNPAQRVKKRINFAEIEVVDMSGPLDKPEGGLPFIPDVDLTQDTPSPQKPQRSEKYLCLGGKSRKRDLEILFASSEGSNEFPNEHEETPTPFSHISALSSRQTAAQPLLPNTSLFSNAHKPRPTLIPSAPLTAENLAPLANLPPAHRYAGIPEDIPVNIARAASWIHELTPSPPPMGILLHVRIPRSKGVPPDGTRSNSSPKSILSGTSYWTTGACDNGDENLNEEEKAKKYAWMN